MLVMLTQRCPISHAVKLSSLVNYGCFQMGLLPKQGSFLRLLPGDALVGKVEDNFVLREQGALAWLLWTPVSFPDLQKLPLLFFSMDL